MKKSKIIVYTESYLPSIGGLENNTALLCETLISLNYEVTLITPQKNATKHQQFTVFENKSLGFFYTQIKKHDLLIVNGGVSFKAILPSLIALKPYMIIYQMATLYKDLGNKNLKTNLLNALRKCLAFLAKTNIAVSEYSFIELSKVFRKKSVGMLINPADPVFSSSLVSKREINQPLKCLFAGRLIDGKGIKLLIKTIKQINENNQIIHLQVIGDGPEKEYVINESKKGFIFYHSPVTKQKLKSWFETVDLTIIPSTSHIEGSPLIMAESISMGIPVLVSSQPAMMESIKYESLIFESGNLEDLKIKLTALIEKNNYNIAKNHCLSLANNYTYANYIKSLKSLIDV